MKNKKAGRRSAPHVGADGGLFRLIGAYVAFASFVYHSLVVLVSNRQSRQRLDRHGTIVVGSCETFHHYNVQGVK